MKYGLPVFRMCIAVLVSALLVHDLACQRGAVDQGNAGNDLIGNLSVFSQDYTGTNTVPGNICVASDYLPCTTENETLGYNGTSHCVQLDVTAGGYGKLFVGGLSPSLSTNLTLDMAMGRTGDDYATLNVYACGTWLIIRLREGAPTDTLEITSRYFNPTLLSTTSATKNVGFSGGGRFQITIVSNSISMTNIVYLNGEEKLTVPFTAYRQDTLVTAYDPFTNPYVYFEFDSIHPGCTAYLQLYSIEQTVPEYRYITPIANPKLTSFGIDGPYAWDTVDNGLSLVRGGTIWADVHYVRRYSSSQLAALKALIADGWELGIHFSSRLSDIPLADAIALMKTETDNITAVFGQRPTSFCCEANADNITHAYYAYTNLDLVWRNGWNGNGCGLANIGNLHDDTWSFWSPISAAGVAIPSFSHELDVTPAIPYSINPGYLSTFVSNYERNGVRIVGFREYWEMAQNSYHTVISNFVCDPGVSLSLEVSNVGGRSRLLVNAPWANAVRDASGNKVPVEVSDLGIVIEVVAGGYTVTASA